MIVISVYVCVLCCSYIIVKEHDTALGSLVFDLENLNVQDISDVRLVRLFRCSNQLLDQRVCPISGSMSNNMLVQFLFQKIKVLVIMIQDWNHNNAFQIYHLFGSLAVFTHGKRVINGCSNFSIIPWIDHLGST